jgi:glyoxylase-like metal-dependent hydrolase (beta-lactamase superfamily II)
MEAVFYKELEGIYRLKVPFEGIYTSVFLVTSEKGAILVDCATTAEDVDGVILPALRAMGYGASDLRAIVLTHRHGDHAGGLPRLLAHAPGLEVITDVRSLWCGIATYPMPGHTADAIGVFDAHTHTLLSGDGLQGAGVDRYRCSLKEPQAYMQTLERIRADEKIENILFSHAYEPWFKDRILGRQAVLECLTECEKYGREK